MRSGFKFTFIPFLIKLLIDLILLTCRVKYHGREAFDSMLANKQPFVIGMWHNCSTICAPMLKNADVTVMVSDSRDGEYVARLAKMYGLHTMRGSSSKGAAKAIREGISVLRKNRAIAITPDGPRGPRYKVQSGLLRFAVAGNAPILPVHIEASRQWEMNSWDRQIFPKPFSTIHVAFGAPLLVDQQRMLDEPEALIQEVEDLLLENVDFVVGLARPE
ncbi:MAG: lysophospholipid acyltransferase family protein [Pseudomonadota bacterium]